jgi:uncharacterized protein
MAVERQGMSHEEAGRKGGQSQGKDNNPGNFANDREKARKAGRKGGERSHGGNRSGNE